MKHRRFKQSKFITLYCMLLALLILSCAIIACFNFYNVYISIIGIFGGILFLVYICVYYNIVHSFFNFGLIFSSMMFLFCFGQFFMYGLGIKYDYFFTNNYYRSLFNNDDFYVWYGEVISILAIGFFQLAMLISVKHKENHEFKNSLITNDSLKTVSRVLFFITFPIMTIYKIYLMIYSLSNGYAATGALVQPFFVRFVGVFFIPAAIGSLVCYRQKNFFMPLCIIIALYSGIGLMIGGRSEPLTLLSGIAMVTLYNKKISTKKLLLFLVIAYCVATLLVSVAEVRVSNSWNFIDIVTSFLKKLVTFRTIVQLIGEMGFSGSSMVWTVYLIKTGQQNLYYGATYVGAILNIFPSSLDVFGVLNGLDKYCHLEGWLTESLGFNFGVGFNLIAEAYLNFGSLSILLMFFYGLLLNFIFNFSRRNGTWNLYKSVVMFSVLLTLPRRASLYFADQWTLCVIFIWLLCRVVMACKRRPQRVLVNGKVTY